MNPWDLKDLVELVKEWGLLLTVLAGLSLWITVGFFRRWVPRLRDLILLVEKTCNTAPDQWKKLEEARTVDLGMIEERCVRASLEASKHFWKSCQEMRCPKMDDVAEELAVTNRLLTKFCDEGNTSREETFKAISRIESSINLFVNEVGREMLKTLRNGTRDGH